MLTLILVTLLALALLLGSCVWVAFSLIGTGSWPPISGAPATAGT